MNEQVIVREEEINIDGIIYIRTVYKDGHFEKRCKEGYENAITNTEERELEIAMNLQYLVDLAEINEEVS